MRRGVLEDWQNGKEFPTFQPFGLSLRTKPSNLPTLQLADALAVAQNLTPKLLSWRIPRRPLWLAGGLSGLTLLLALLPNSMDAILAQRAMVQEAAQQQAEAIQEARRELEKSTEPTSEERAKALQALAELMKELAANPGDLEQALADLAAAEARLRELQDPDAAARQVAVEQIANQLTALAHGQERSSNDLDAAATALTELAAALGAMDSGEQQELAEALEQMAAQAAPTDADLAEALLDMAEGPNRGCGGGSQRGGRSPGGAGTLWSGCRFAERPGRCSSPPGK
jgi:hypothetical protein